MAWPTRSKVIGEWRQATTANTKYYGTAVPAGATWLAKDVSLYNGSAANTTFYIWLKRAGVEYPIFQWVGLIPEGVYSQSGMTKVAEAGDQYGFSTSAAKTLVAVVLFGAKL